MIGMFAASELFRLVRTRYLVEDSAARKVSVRVIVSGFRMAFSLVPFPELAHPLRICCRT
jgi:putative tricarboxylic transport membrane protein